MAVAITEFAIPTAGGKPYGITAGPDGHLWFTEEAGNKIGRMTTGGAVLNEFVVPTSGSQPEGITSGPDGNLWFAEVGGKIGRLTPEGVFTEFPLPSADGSPRFITTGADGNLWFSQLGTRNTIGRITPQGVLTEFPIPTFGGQSHGITAGPDGNAWFTELAGNKIGRITPSGEITEFPIPSPINSYPLDITTGPDGNLWFTEGATDRIGRITPAGVITQFDLADGSDPYGITAASDGSLWFTAGGANKIGRITVDGQITYYPIPTASSQPRIITEGPDGNLWFTEFAANKIGRLDFSAPGLYSYDASLGTMPEQQGFTRTNGNSTGPEPVVADGSLHQFEDTSPDATEYWVGSGQPLDFANKSYVMEATLEVISSNYIPDIGTGQRSGYYFTMTDAAGRHFAIGIAADGITINTDSAYHPSNGVPFTAFDTTGGFHTYRFVIDNGVGALSIDGVLFASVPVGGAVRADIANFVAFGDGSGRGISETYLQRYLLEEAQADVAVLNAVTEGNVLELTYEVHTIAADTFEFAVARSADGVFGISDEVLDTIVIDNPADLTVGLHTLTFMLGAGAGEVALPGFGAAETDDDYRLLAVVNSSQSAEESDFTNNLASITGAYHPAGGAVFVHGGEGDDSMVVSASGQTLLVNLNGDTHSFPSGLGADVTQVRARLHAGADTVTAGTVAKSMFILGGEDNDDLRGGAAVDILRGDAGDDTLRVSSGADSLRGGLGDDTVVGTNATSTWTISAPNAGSVTGSTTYAEVEALRGGSGADRFNVGAAGGISGVIDGGGGSNTLAGGGLANIWRITAANAGTLNDDSFVNIRSLVGGDKADLFIMEVGGALAGSLNGASGVDTVDYSAHSSNVAVNLASKTATAVGSLLGIESIRAGSGVNTLTGPNSAATWNITAQNAGSVAGVSFGSFANLIGGSGNDTFVFTAGQGVLGSIAGGGGVNALNYSAYVAGVIVDLGAGTATGVGGGVTNIRNVFGGAGADHLTGNSLANVLLGNAGADTLLGGGGNDVLVGGTGNDTLVGGDQRSLLIGGRGADSISGGAEDDLIVGGSTSHDANLAALAAIMAEWTRADLAYGDRINHLRGAVAGGLNGTTLFTSSTVKDDAVGDMLMGAAALDWFWASLGETSDLEAAETVN